MNNERHVLAPFSLDPKRCFSIGPNLNVTVGLEGRGVNEASAYPLFCSTHDHGLFDEFDRTAIALNSRSAGRAAYRAACLEAHKKKTEKYSPAGILEMVAPGIPADPDTYRRIAAWATGKANATDFISRFESCVAKDDWSCLTHLVIEVTGPPSVLACGAVSSEITPDGVINYESSDFSIRGDYTFISSRSGPTCTQFIFSYFHGDQLAKRLVKWLSKQSSRELTRVLPYILADLTEDLFVNPDWFWSLDEADRERFGQRLQIFRVLGFKHERTIVPWTSLKTYKVGRS